jgi:CubicO group peptidase (beta-lactamase class C family)
MLSSFLQAQHRPQIIDSIISNRIRDNMFSGSVFIARNGELVYHRTEGFINKQTGLSFKDTTVSSIASVGKIFTAVLIEKLVQDGRLRLDLTIQHYLPEYKIPNADRITLQHLLTHTGCTGNYMENPNFLRMLDTLNSMETLLNLIPETMTGCSEPGKTHNYSNSGYIILGKIIESVTGKSYNNVLHEQIVKPAGMDSIIFQPKSLYYNEVANGHTSVPGTGEWVKSDLKSFPAPDGGFYTTAKNLWLFDQALFRYKIINKGRLEEMMTKSIEAVVPGLGKIQYGLGLMRFDYGAQRYSLGHNGGFPGYGCEYKHYFFPDGTEYTLIILSNFERTIRPLLFKLEKLILEKRF